MEEEKGEADDERIVERLWEIELILLAILVISVGTLMTIVIRGF